MVEALVVRTPELAIALILTIRRVLDKAQAMVEALVVRTPELAIALILAVVVALALALPMAMVVRTPTTIQRQNQRQYQFLRLILTWTHARTTMPVLALFISRSMLKYRLAYIPKTNFL